MPINPNPDRARRAAAPSAAIVVRNAASDSDEEAIVAAQIVAGGAPVAAVAVRAAAPQALAPIFGHAAVRATGLEQSSTLRKRTSSVQRTEPCWECVSITDEEDAHQPRWRCSGCGEFKSGGATRVTNHLLGEGGSKK